MTTIIYDHKNKQIAIDSRCAIGELIITDELIKSRLMNDVWFFLAGHNADIDKVIDQYPNVKCINNVSGFIVKDKKAYTAQIIDKEFFESELTYNDADGNGYLLAIAALDFGCSAKAAIEYVITRNINTGGKVHVYDIETGKFI